MTSQDRSRQMSFFDIEDGMSLPEPDVSGNSLIKNPRRAIIGLRRGIVDLWKQNGDDENVLSAEEDEKMNDATICEKCGNQMQYFRDKSTCGWTCPKCGWGVAATYHDPIDLDECVYTINIPSQEAEFNAIKAVSSVFLINYIEARKRILDGSLNVSGDARSIRNKAAILSEGCVDYKIEPDFPYSLDG